MKNIAKILLAIVAVLAISTSCSSDDKDMKPGEVSLEGNDYRNDDQLQAITITPAVAEDGTQAAPIEMSALELNILWHSVIINAEKQLEYATDTEKNLYTGPKEIEETFFLRMSQSMGLLKEQYPQQYEAMVKEFIRADVHAFVSYVWCAQDDDYIDLEFRATPDIEPTTPPTDDTDTPGEEPDVTPAE